jgi:tetratricopeptide (TPR) repeat protein
MRRDEEGGMRLTKFGMEYIGGRLPTLVIVPEGFDPYGTAEKRRVRPAIDEGQVQLALANATRVLEAHPERAKPWAERAMALTMLGKEADALVNLERAIEIEPRADTIMFRRALYNRLGIWETSPE